VGRCAGFFVSAAWMKLDAPAGSHAGILGGDERTAFIEPSRVLMPNGGHPTSSSNASTPQAHASTRAPYASCGWSLFSLGSRLSGQRMTSAHV
jgi:hypothetical protein